MRHYQRPTRLLFAMLAALGVATSSLGCGSAVSPEFSNRLIGASGELVVSEDVATILDDPNLNGDEKRAALRDLGIEDEQLIDALVTL